MFRIVKNTIFILLASFICLSFDVIEAKEVKEYQFEYGHVISKKDIKSMVKGKKNKKAKNLKLIVDGKKKKERNIILLVNMKQKSKARI